MLEILSRTIDNMHKLKEFPVSLAYAQMTICDKAYDEEFYECCLQELQQGFLCVPGYAVFFALWDAARCAVEVYISQELSLHPNTIRAIAVPFPISDSGKVKISDCFYCTEEEVCLEQGEYTLVFENGVDEEYADVIEAHRQQISHQDVPMWCRFTFVAKASEEPEILKLDEGLSPSYPLMFGEDLEQMEGAIA